MIVIKKILLHLGVATVAIGWEVFDCGGYDLPGLLTILVGWTLVYYGCGYWGGRKNASDERK
jgi:hypothetical protein